MTFAEKSRDRDLAGRYAAAIEKLVTQPWNIMEVCGGQTHAIVRYGIDKLLPPTVNLLHGPGCPVCVTPTAYIDKAIDLAGMPNVIFCSYGDMIHVPGTISDLDTTRAAGGDVRIVYSPLDAVRIAQENPTNEIFFFAVGFETTAPANAMAVLQAAAAGLTNFSVLVSQVLVPPAIEALLSASDHQIDGFLAAGHVCTIMGIEEYEPLAAKYHVPIVVTGFEPVDILQGVYMCLRQLEQQEAMVENQYARAVQSAGNAEAQRIMKMVFEVIPREWRGIGEIGQSGLGLRPGYAAFDAEVRFGAVGKFAEKETPCISGDILRGQKKPTDCPLFGGSCNPEAPMGVTMVSSEGACAAYYRYRRASGEVAT